MKHTIDIRIYYEDTDAGGIVYHANYLKFGERGRTEFLRHTGYDNWRLQKDRGVMFVVRHIEIDYLTPAFLDDSLKMETTIREMKNTSFMMHQRTVRPDPNDPSAPSEVITDMRVALVCVDTSTFKPVRVPEDVKSSFQTFLDVIQ